ncbi:hypothetical protein M8494_13950 [Serratia ureilytica]
MAPGRQYGAKPSWKPIICVANLAGHGSHGVGMIPSYGGVGAGAIAAQSARRSGARRRRVLTLDGARARGFGQVVASEAMALGIERAGKLGLAGGGAAQRTPYRPHRPLGGSSAPAPVSSRFTSSTWWAIRWWRRSAAAIAASAPTRSAPFPAAGPHAAVAGLATSGIAFGKPGWPINSGLSVAPGYLGSTAAAPHHRAEGDAQSAKLEPMPLFGLQ